MKKFGLAAMLLAALGSCGIPHETGCIGPPRDFAITVNQLVTPLLAGAIDKSRKDVERNNVKEIPEFIRNRLSPYFSGQKLSRVRWTVAEQTSGIARLVVGDNTRYKAITLGNLIVFEDEYAAHDIGLWAHELLHVRQYEEAGNTQRFARKYLARWPEIEGETIGETNEILDDLGIEAQQNAPTVDRCPARHRLGA